MIWSGGEILPDDGLAIPSSDRTFEHGLGLFETLRTWDGRADPARRATGRGCCDRPRRWDSRSTRPSFPDDEAVAGSSRPRAPAATGCCGSPRPAGSDRAGSVVWMRSPAAARAARSRPSGSRSDRRDGRPRRPAGPAQDAQLLVAGGSPTSAARAGGFDETLGPSSRRRLLSRGAGRTSSSSADGELLDARRSTPRSSRGSCGGWSSSWPRGLPMAVREVPGDRDRRAPARPTRSS